MDKKRFVRFSSVGLAVILIFIGININEQNKINKPAEARKYYLTGLGYSSKGEFAGAKPQFKKALEIDKFNHFPEFALETLTDIDRGVISKEYGACFFKGLKCLENRQYQQALKEFENAIKINPGYVKAYNCIGNVYHLLRKPQDAIIYYEKSIQIDPNYANAYNNLGGEYFSLKQYRQAITYVEKAARINPNDPQNYCNLGLAYSFLGKPRQARENFQKAKEIFKLQKDARNLKKVEITLKEIPADESIKGERK